MNMMNRSIAAVVATLINTRTIYVPIVMALLLAIPMLLLGCPDTPASTHPYVCENGTAQRNEAALADTINCATCDGGYVLVGAVCFANAYVCKNGTPVTEVVPDGENGENRCDSCDLGYALAGTACAPDRDGDNVADTTDNCPDVPNATDQTAGNACDTDIDDDDDGLIEIWTLEQLYNMRFNLDGTSYKDSDSATAVTTGAPTASPPNCQGITTTTNLCGYELAQSLDFDKDKDGRTWDETTLELDADDDDNRYFDVDTGGWSPVGTSPEFGAIFEGNGHTIANLAIRRGQANIGLFGTVRGRIRNVGVTTFLAAYSGPSVAGVAVGGLAGSLRVGSIIASYATGTVSGGGGGNVRAGGLAGFTGNNASIIASYAAGAVNGGDGDNDNVGGLVGSQTGDKDIIIASYATGAVNGGDGEGDNVGGLVGSQDTGFPSVIASYATGAVNGGDGDNDRVGGLVGTQSLSAGISSAVSSYATGAADGGSGAGDFVGNLIGDLGVVTDIGRSYPASYGFGAVSGQETAGISPTLPAGVTSPAGLLATNTAGCDNSAYAAMNACVSATREPGVWTTIPGAGGTCAAPTGGTSDVTYTDFTTFAACLESIQWVTWNAATSQNLGAWDFGTPTQAPRLRYADYDGAGTDYDCNMFPAMACGTLLPGQ